MSTLWPLSSLQLPRNSRYLYPCPCSSPPYPSLPSPPRRIRLLSLRLLPPRAFLPLPLPFLVLRLVSRAVVTAGNATRSVMAAHCFSLDAILSATL
ncbi:hypothetical protein PAXRUDRAFT_794451 [Paxillus rubicundulus Ve08.2h10]|uniref:Uncharacterized protein n=1 Tax=Paxillus rubicundulus Ve08.2h10 TaxID=930991 RepID=A0A0D0E443_9AGAM|nr:hypothetical protein PAXRUDRAFT_794451 [Paxillus rubicundulus Ve08.2h10]